MRPPLLVLVVAACSGGGETVTDAGGGSDAVTRCSGFVGDRNQPVQIEAILTLPDTYNGDGEISTLKTVMGTDGMRVPLIQAPQGGKHVFAGVRVKNIDTCPVRLVGTVRDISGFIRFESRPVDMILGSDGWAYAANPLQIGSYANIPLCPNVWADRDIHEQTYQLELRVSDSDDRTGTTAISVVPYCGEPAREAECRCSCRKDAVLGECPGDTDAG